MRFFRAEALCFVAILGVSAQDLTTAERRHRDYPAFADLADRAQAVAPELRSLILTRLAKQPSLKDREWKEELLEQAFDAAQLAFVQSQVDIVPAANGPMPGGLPPRYERGNAMNKGIDRLSLATAAVFAMVSVNPAKARTLFDRIQLPESHPLECSQGLVPNTAKYFQTATRLAGQDPEVLRLAMLKAASASQMAAVGAMMLGAPPELIQTFAGMLASIPVESRAWSNNLEDFTASVAKLFDSLGVAERASLLQGWRSYLKRGFTAVQCAEAANPNWGTNGWTTNAIEAFNKRAITAGADPLGKSEIENKQTADSRVIDIERESSDRVRELPKVAMQLLATREDKKDVEWQARFKRFISAVEEVKKDEISEDLILFKAGLFSLVANAAPAGPLRDFVSARFLDQLKIANVAPEAFPAWHNAVNNWLDLVNVLGQSKAESLEILEASGQPMLVAIARLNKLN
jgi:hypothetical protein